MTVIAVYCLCVPERTDIIFPTHNSRKNPKTCGNVKFLMSRYDEAYRFFKPLFILFSVKSILKIKRFCTVRVNVEVRNIVISY